MQAQNVTVQIVEQRDHTYEVDLTDLSHFEVIWLLGALIALLIRRQGWKGALSILRMVGDVLVAEGLLPENASP